MKKLSIKMLPAALFAACLILLTASCSSWDWSLKYSKTAKVDNMEFALNPEGKEAFVAACVWDGTEEGRRFVIPDTVEGCTVFKMGGYFGRGLPMPFYIAAESDEMPTAAGESGENAEGAEPVIVEAQFLFTIVIGQYLTEISNVRDPSDFLRVLEDGTVILFHPVFAFEVDEKNPAFYAKNGRLYAKRGDTLVTDFPYPLEE